MASIVIKDLKESVELDRAAMRRIAGGWSRQRLSSVPSFESSVLQKSPLLEHLNRSGFDFGSNRW